MHSLLKFNSKEYYKLNKERLNNNNKKYYRELRKEIIELLGRKCKRCGINDQRVLTIDHIFGGGKKEFDNSESSWKYYKYIKEIINNQKLDPPFQLLCHNCNHIKRIEIDSQIRKIRKRLKDGD